MSNYQSMGRMVKPKEAAIDIEKTMSTTAKQHEAPFRFMDFPEVSGIVGMTKTPIRSRIKAGTFPAPVALSSRCVRWRSTDIAAWLEAQTDTTKDERSAKGTKARDSRMAKGGK